MIVNTFLIFAFEDLPIAPGIECYSLAPPAYVLNT